MKTSRCSGQIVPSSRAPVPDHPGILGSPASTPVPSEALPRPGRRIRDAHRHRAIRRVHFDAHLAAPRPPVRGHGRREPRQGSVRYQSPSARPIIDDLVHGASSPQSIMAGSAPRSGDRAPSRRRWPGPAGRGCPGASRVSFRGSEPVELAPGLAAFSGGGPAGKDHISGSRAEVRGSSCNGRY